MTEPIDRAAIRRRTEAASEGPWAAQGSHVEGDRVIAVACTLSRANDDAEFIAHARSDIPALLAALEKAEGEVERLEAAQPRCDGGCDYNSGPEETCSAHGRPVAEVWNIVEDVVRQRDELGHRIAAAEELHRPALAVFNWHTGLRYEEPCRGCNGRAGVHECGCWSDVDAEFVCRECDQPKNGGSRRVTPWPCPTFAALHPADPERSAE